MPIKPQKGTILIPLILILALSFGVFIMAKFLSNSQADVEAAIDSRYDNYSVSLSSKADPPDKWVTYSNPSLKYKIKYPKQWVGNNQATNISNFLDSYERFLSNKINLKITVSKSFDIPENARQAKFDKNTFDLYQDENNVKSAVAHENNLYYNVSLKQDNYFASQQEFTAFFFQLLKRFEFSN